MTPAAVILAGGASRRMGRPKALLPFRGETILDRLIGLYQTFCAPVIVVLGHSSSAIRDGIQRGAGIEFAVNPDPERGQLSSLQCGLALARGEVALFTPVDYAAVETATVAQLLEKMAASTEAALVAPSYRGRHGHPVLIREYVKRELLALPPDGMAREVIHRHREAAVYVDVDDAAVCQDLDSPDDYARLVAAEAARG